MAGSARAKVKRVSGGVGRWEWSRLTSLELVLVRDWGWWALGLLLVEELLEEGAG